MAMGVIFMVLSALVFAFAPGPFARLITEDAAVVAQASAFLAIAAVFQIFDGTQVIGAGALRGAGDTSWPVAITIAGYYGVGLSTALVLTFVLDWGPIGLWWGLVVGLSTVAVLLVMRFERLTRKSVARV